MNYRKRFIRIGIALAAVIALGTLGYVLIEGYSWLDAIYMTIITISTVGFKEVQACRHSASNAGAFGAEQFGEGEWIFHGTTRFRKLTRGSPAPRIGTKAHTRKGSPSLE